MTRIVSTPPEHVTAKVPATVGIVERHADGALHTVDADALAFLAGHLIGLDLAFEALEPPELRRFLRRAAEQLVDAHRAPFPKQG